MARSFVRVINPASRGQMPSFGRPAPTKLGSSPGLNPSPPSSFYSFYRQQQCDIATPFPLPYPGDYPNYPVQNLMEITAPLELPWVQRGNPPYTTNKGHGMLTSARKLQPYRSKQPKQPKSSPPPSQTRPRSNIPHNEAAHPNNARPAFPMGPKMMTLTAVAMFAFSAYSSYLYVTYKKAVEASKTLDVPLDVSDRYHKTAQTYDAEVDMAERIMRLGKRRKEMVQRARGHVLEVSCGTGRNMDYYLLGERRRRGVGKDGKPEVQGCRSITFVDQSGEMVEIARSKFEKLYPAFSGLAAFRTQDAMDSIEDGGRVRKFDTIIQTMGVCSHPDPVSLLAHLGTLTEPERGQIHLLEHGRSYYSWLNDLLDNLAPAHADRHGCWWNRDIGEIVRKSGLEVVESERWHLGTTWRFVLRPRTIDEQENEKGGEKGSKSGSGVNWGDWISWSPVKEVKK